MAQGGILRELRDGHVPAMRTGMSALVLGAAVIVTVLFLLSPAMDGLVGLDERTLDRPVAEPRVVTPPRLTAAQRMAARRTAIRVATSQLGVRERGGSNASPRITNYRRAVTGPGERPWVAEPWCADFVSWAWKRAGVPIGFEGRGSDYVPELVAWASVTRRWHWARDGYRPRPGDLIVFSSGGSMRGHIGMVARVSKGRLITIEGNFSDQVASRTVKPWAPFVTGFISPV